MIVRPLPISPLLQPYIAHAIYLKKDNATVTQFRIIPRFYGLWAFTLEASDPLIIDFDNGNRHLVAPNNIYTGGSGYIPVAFDIPGRAEWILAMPRPHCTALFWREDAHHFTNTMYCVSNAGQQLRVLNEQVNTVNNVDSKWQHIQQHLEKKLNKPANNLNYVNQALKLMFSSGGAIKIEDLSQQSYTCSRNLRDSFRQHVGYSPKKFASMIRFNSFVQQLLDHSSPHKTFAQTCLALGYYDLSHLHKDFMRFIGIGPENFLSQEQGLNRLLLG